MFDAPILEKIENLREKITEKDNERASILQNDTGDHVPLSQKLQEMSVFVNSYRQKQENEETEERRRQRETESEIIRNLVLDAGRAPASGRDS